MSASAAHCSQALAAVDNSLLLPSAASSSHTVCESAERASSPALVTSHGYTSVPSLGGPSKKQRHLLGEPLRVGSIVSTEGSSAGKRICNHRLSVRRDATNSNISHGIDAGCSTECESANLGEVPRRQGLQATEGDDGVSFRSFGPFCGSYGDQTPEAPTHGVLNSGSFGSAPAASSGTIPKRLASRSPHTLRQESASACAGPLLSPPT